MDLETAVKFPSTTKPVTPLEQLLGVFPPAAAFYVPPSWRPLMTSEESPVADLYPTSFVTDLNGKKWAWQGVTLLPFVDSKRLKDAVAPVFDKLRPVDVRRNLLGTDLVAVHVTHPLAKWVLQPLCCAS